MPKQNVNNLPTKIIANMFGIDLYELCNELKIIMNKS